MTKPSWGLIRAALLIALMQTPHRFRTKQQLWAYCGLALRTYDSGEYRFVGGQLKRYKEAVTIRGLNKKYNHDLACSRSGKRRMDLALLRLLLELGFYFITDGLPATGQ